MRLLMRVYAQYPDSRCRVYQQYSVNECILLTKAWKKCPDKQDGSCEHIVGCESEDNKNGSPLVVRVDLNNMVQSTNASMPEAGDVGIVYRLPIPVRECPFRPPGMPAMCLPFPRDAHNATTTPIRFLETYKYCVPVEDIG